MPKNTIDEKLDEYYAPIKLPDINRNGLKQALYQDLLELASVYNAKSTNGVINSPNTGVLAIPLEALKQYFGKE